MPKNDGGPWKMPKNDGGPAFPQGTSLRDWLAGQALTGILAALKADELVSFSHRRLGLEVYDIADAVLQAKESPRVTGGESPQAPGEAT